jgi:hypothetical protein
MALSPAFFEAISRCLNAHESAHSGPVTAENLVARVTEFQAANGQLYVDGKVGPKTLWALQHPLLQADGLLELVDLQSDTPPRGYDVERIIRLRSDAAEAFGRIMTRVREKGGLILGAGGLRRLNEPDGPNRSASSFHYPGLAVDLSPYAGARNPAKDPYLCELSADNGWTVWTRGEGGEEREISAVTSARSDTGPSGAPRGRTDYVTITRTPVSGKFVNVTAIALEEGFHQISPRPAWRNFEIRNFMSSEWWHFQYEKALTPEFSMFGIELSRVKNYFNTNSLTGSTPWGERNRVFGKDWN